MATPNYEICVREYFLRSEGRIVRWGYAAGQHGMYEGIIPEDFKLPEKKLLDKFWEMLEAERAAEATETAQRRSNALELIGSEAQKVIATIDQDIIDLAAVTTLLEIKPIVDRILNRERGIIKALMFFKDST